MSAFAFALLVLELPVAAPPVKPTPIINGQVAQTCEFPSAVALTKWNYEFCTGTLIHPNVVLTAAHCIHPDSGWGLPEEIVFGEDIAEPQLSVGIVDCEMHPLYDHYAPLHSPEDAHDLAYCVLDQPVTSVTPTPPIMGCEVDQLTPGATVRIVGFGADEIVPSGDSFETFGTGTKRFTSQVLEKVDELDQLFLLGMNASACSGDSGGPAYLQLADGSWRVLSAASRIHPDAPAEPPWCLYGVVHTGVWNEMAWFESASGFDLTPCHEADGTWAPGPDCSEFPLDMQAAASWADSCAAQPVSGPSMSCAAGESDTDTGTDTDTDTDSSTDTDTSTSTDGTSSATDSDSTTMGADSTTTGDTTTTADPGTSSSTTGDTTTTGDGVTTTAQPTEDAPTSGVSTSSDAATTDAEASSDGGSGSATTTGQSQDGEGCGCRSTGGGGGWLAGLVLAFGRRRRRAGS